MERLVGQEKTFKWFEYSRYPTDVKIQKSFWTLGILQERGEYFSSKNKLYGYKV